MSKTRKKIENKQIIEKLDALGRDIGTLWAKIDHLAGAYKDFLHTPNNCPALKPPIHFPPIWKYNEKNNCEHCYCKKETYCSGCEKLEHWKCCNCGNKRCY